MGIPDSLTVILTEMRFIQPQEPIVGIWIRRKNESGKWRYQRVNLGGGRRPASLSQGRLYLRYTLPNGKQPFTPVGDNLDKAIAAAEKIRTALLAAAKGLTVTEEMGNANRVPIKTAIEKFPRTEAGQEQENPRSVHQRPASIPRFIRQQDSLHG